MLKQEKLPSTFSTKSGAKILQKKEQNEHTPGGILKSDLLHMNFRK